MFKVVEHPLRTIWCALDGGSTYYVGQLVKCTGTSAAYIDGTVAPLISPSGEADLTNDLVVFGVISGTNDRRPTFDSIGQYITGITTQAAQIARITSEFQGAEGMYIKSDPQPLVEVTVIGPNSVLKGDIFNGAHGTACTVVTDQDGTDTTGYTTAGLTDAIPFTPADMLHTWYCRAGTNAGLYRTGDGTSTTLPEVHVAFPYDVGIGDSFVAVPLKQGFSMPLIDSVGLYIDQGTDAVTNSFELIVLELNLETAGREHAIFMFTPTHFGQSRNE